MHHHSQDYVRGYLSGLECSVQAARIVMDEFANETYSNEVERELAKKIAANVLLGIEIAVRTIKDVEGIRDL